MVVVPATVPPGGVPIAVIYISPASTISPTIGPWITNSWIPDDHAWSIVRRNHDPGSDHYRGWYSNADVNPRLSFGRVQTG